MAPTRKSRSVYKRFSSEVSPDKDVGNSKSSSRPRKKKLSDMLGPQWSEEDLERFYEAYRKHGRDWRKVAATLRDRTVEMVEALYNMNRAYLSLPEGISSVVGLIAMMTDHYNVLEGSDDGEETNNDRMDHRTTKKRKRGKVQLKEDIVNPRTGSSNDDCLSLLTKRRVDGSLPRAVGKRTPRVPVSYLYRKDNYSPSSKRARKLEVEGNDDDIAHGAALVLKAASQRGDSPQVSVCPFSRRTEHVKASPVESHERMSRVTKRSDVSEDEEWHEGSMESKGAENGDCTKNESSIMEIEGIGTVEVLRRGKKFYKKKEKFGGGEKKHFEDGGEACSGTEGGTDSTSKKKLNFEVSNTKVEHRGRKSQRKRNKKLFFGVVDIRLENADESTALDALQTLADLSLMMPTALDSESFIGLEDDKPFVDEDDTTIHPAMTSADVQSDKVLGRKEKLNAASGADTKKYKLGKSSTMSDNSSKVKKQNVGNKAEKRKGKPTELKLMDSEAQVDSLIGEHMKDQDVNKEAKQLVKGKSTGQMSNLIDPKSSLSKGWKSGLARDRSAKPLESSFPYNKDLKGAEATVASATVASTAKQVNSATRQRSRRKSIVQRTMILTKTPDKTSRKRSDKYAMRLPEKALSWKDKLSSCLSLPVARKWCIFEWFYSAIDYPWFAKREFVDYLNHVGLGHIPRLTRIEWSVIRSSLGKPRRFSENFLREERRKLERYRESVRRHYTELRTGVREGLPTDLARPLCVGQRVIAIHPKTREVHDGSVLTVDHEKCMIQFDRADIGVEFVMDIDCMPFNPLDNMPEALRRNRIFIDKYATISKDHQMEASVNFVGPILYGSHGLPVNAQTPTIDFLKQAKDASHAVSQARGGPPGGVNSQPLVFNQPSTVAHVQAREADIRALCELTRALDKKEALIMELRNMNNDMLEDQINGDGSVKETESFKKHYAMVLVQLKEAGSQASSALVHLRERNTYTSSLPPWLKSPANSSIPFGLLQDSQKYAPSNESECNVPDIVKNSRAKALAMVDTAIQAIASLKEGEDAFTKIREAFDRYNQTQCSDSRLLNIRYPEKVKVADPILKSQSNTGASESGQPSETKSLASSDKIESQVPAELIASCVATLLMLQTCTERQYPPADMAQIIDSAVSSLHPCSSQNLPIYREIEMSMGRLKTQILALVPTHI